MRAEESCRRLRVLVCAYACQPDKGSEPGVGWTWIRHLARYCQLDVITSDHAGSRVAIEQVLAVDAELAATTRFHFLSDFVEEAWARHPLLMRYYQPLYYGYYERWMRSACELARGLAREVDFDLVHQLTMIGYREPGYLWQLGKPFVWGPVGGTQNVPWRFLPALGAVEAIRHAARNLINAWQFRHSERVRSALLHAAGLISTATDTAAAFQRVHDRVSVVVPASFADGHHRLARERVRSPGEPLRIVFSGIHVSRKGLPFLLRALARLSGDLDWTLEVIGAGAMSARWRQLARVLGLEPRISWLGQVGREVALEAMSRAHLFVLPSLLEGSPAVVVEALSLGIPVISIDHHGMADYIDASCGVKMEARTPNQLVADLAKTLERLGRDAKELNRLSRGALARARFFSAEQQIRAVLGVYERAVHRSVVNGSL